MVFSSVIIGDSFTFPEGNAATNRVYTYAKGLQENGWDSNIICFLNEYNTERNGVSEGIKYYHPFVQTRRSPYFFIRRWHNFCKYINTLKQLRRINSVSNIAQITVYTTLLTTHLFAWLLSRQFQAKLIKECSEHPLRFYQKSTLSKLKGNLKFKIETRFCDGVFCISRHLVEFYLSQGYASDKLLLVPSTVDPSRFSTSLNKPLPYRYVGYFGALTFKRDNVDNLIKAFYLVADKYPEIRLVLGGPGSGFDRGEIKKLIDDLGISSRTLVLDYLPRNEITNYIVNSDILVMMRSKDMEAMASFPSKLTEYLATSRPVVTVDVGEISDYLTDGVNSFLVESGNHEILAERISYILANYEQSLNIARKGKKLTETVFNYNYQARRIIQFIECLKQN